MEFHGGWDLTSAVRIAQALEPYRPMWLEDILLPGNFGQYRELAGATAIPLTVSERIAGRTLYLGLSATEEGVVRMKPQNLLINLPLNEA